MRNSIEPCLCGDPACGRCFPQTPTWPPAWKGPQWKQGRVAARKAKLKVRRQRVTKERDAKADTRKRDKVCRFPLCGCRRIGEGLKAFPEVSHTKHKGPGGDPTGKTSTTENLVLLCKWRHQDAPISRHKQTLRVVYLTDRGFDGPIAWEVDCNRLGSDSWQGSALWREVAREAAVGQWEPFEDWQREILVELSHMEQ